SAAQSSLVIPDAVTGLGYTTTLTLVNVSSSAVDATISFAGASQTFHFSPRTSLRVSLADLLRLTDSQLRTGAVRVNVSAGIVGVPQSLLGLVDIENSSGLVSIGARPPATDVLFPHVANGNGLFTGLCFATGSAAATITIDVYSANGG